MNKKLQTKTETYVQFSEEEMEELNLEIGQKFTVSEEDGTIILTPFKTLEIELEKFTRGELIGLMQISCREDISMNEVISNVLMEVVKNHDEGN